MTRAALLGIALAAAGLGGLIGWGLHTAAAEPEERPLALMRSGEGPPIGYDAYLSGDAKAGEDLVFLLRGGDVIVRSLARVPRAQCKPDPIDPDQLIPRCSYMLSAGPGPAVFGKMTVFCDTDYCVSIQ